VYVKIPHIRQMAGNCGSGSHGRAYEMRASAAALTAFEIAVGR
jgi:hypothetical protein